MLFFFWGGGGGMGERLKYSKKKKEKASKIENGVILYVRKNYNSQTWREQRHIRSNIQLFHFRNI